jgi:small nuclear ribonucleoprotein G
MTKVYPPELKKYMDKNVSVRLNGSRTVTGVVRGFDPFMNLVLDEASDSSSQMGMIVIRGNAIMAIEALERI